MLRPSCARNGTAGVSRGFVIVVAWLLIGWSLPALPDEQSHLQLAPIHFTRTVNGDLFYSYFYNRPGTNDYSVQQLGAGVNVMVTARSFIWQPWFAGISSSLGVGVFTSRATVSSTTTTKNGNNILSGDATLNVLQRSRFPFMAKIYQHQNQARTSTNSLNDDHITRGYSLNQQYRTLNDIINSSFYYNHNADGRIGIGTESVSNQSGFTLSSQLSSNQTLLLDGGTNNLTYPLQGGSNTFDKLSVVHNYRPNNAISLGSSLNLNNSSIQSVTQSDYGSQQFSSIGSWRPSRSPLTLISSVRLLQSDTRVGATSSKFSDSNFNLGANYAWSRLLRTYGYVNVYDSNGIQAITTNAALSAQRALGDQSTIDVWGFRYTRSANFTISNQSATTNSANQTITQSSQNLGGGIGHGLDKSIQMGGGNASISFHQALSAFLSTKAPVSSHLISGASFGWVQTKSRSGSSRFDLRANDSRDLYGPQRYFQLVNLQASRTENVARNQSLAGNLTFQASRSGANNLPASSFSANQSASLLYRNSRVFGVRNLVLTSSLMILSAGISTSFINQSTKTWNNDLEYSIGRLQLGIKTTFTQFSNNQQQSSLLFNANRSF